MLVKALRCGFPGLIAPASLKLVWANEFVRSSFPGFPGLIAPASLKPAFFSPVKIPPLQVFRG